MLYTLFRLEISHRTRWCCKMRDSVPIARDIPAFIMYCVNGASRSSLLIESTNPMIPDWKRHGYTEGILRYRDLVVSLALECT